LIFYILPLLRFRILPAVLSLFFISCAPAVTVPKKSSIPLQAVIVRTADWNTSAALLQRYERKEEDAPWNAAGEKVPAVVGRKGLGWGKGIHPKSFYDGPEKWEGDEKAPAGIFLLSSAFGYAPADEVGWIKLPYRQSNAHIQCVDDTQSPYYNKLVDTTQVKPAWQSYENMQRQDDLYRLGVVVEHNTDPTIAGQGSCIFLHIWRGPSEGTAGCTAMEAEQLEKLLHWLDANALPILVQLPESEYVRFHSLWHLP
jgi:L,D-peptidoglycan transpeptidase YkuD (ErfK/YbiS/YcfS/YnhG family)